MKITHLIIVSVLSFGSIAAQSTDEEYIAKFAKIAVEEMQLYRIPASITLAQGLLETADGQSELAQNANNHFGIKCKKEWTGDTYRYTDDAFMECFRKYNSAQESYRDHSKFLAERPYYKALFNLDIYDYKAWAYGLKKAGYATNPRYAPLLISKIEKYNLNQFDRLTPEQVNSKLAELYPSLTPSIEFDFNDEKEEIPVSEKPIAIATTEKPKPSPQPETILKAPEPRIHPLDRIQRHTNKKLKYITIQPGETLSKIGKIYNISTDQLQDYNDIENPNQIQSEEILFLQQKKNKGSTKYHTVTQGESLRSISQKEGIQLKYLLKRNRLNENDTIEEGMILNLKGKKKK